MYSDHHLFALVEQDHLPQGFDYMHFFTHHQERLVPIPGDIIYYIIDSIRWIRGINPTNNTPLIGINEFGPTVISAVESEKLRNICDAWVNLFRLGPEHIHLTGSWTRHIDDDGNESQGRYEELCFSRERLINHLHNLSLLAKTASEGHHLLLHYGL